MKPTATQPGAVKAIVIAAVTMLVGAPIAVTVYWLARPSVGGGAAIPVSSRTHQSKKESATENGEPSQWGRDYVSDLEEFRKLMSDEQFEETFGPAIRHERENPTTVLNSDVEVDGLPAQVNRLRAPTITDSGLARLAAHTSVRELNLEGNEVVTDDGLRHVARIKGLSSLGLSDTRLTDSGIKHLRGMQLTYISLWNTSIGDEALGYISEMLLMKQVQIRNCPRVTDAGVQRLGTLRNLWMVNLSECKQVSDSSLRTLSEIPAMKYVQLFGCPKITDKAIDAFVGAGIDREVDR